MVINALPDALGNWEVQCSLPGATFVLPVGLAEMETRSTPWKPCCHEHTRLTVHVFFTSPREQRPRPSSMLPSKKKTSVAPVTRVGSRGSEYYLRDHNDQCRGLAADGPHRAGRCCWAIGRAASRRCSGCCGLQRRSGARLAVAHGVAHLAVAAVAREAQPALRCLPNRRRGWTPGRPGPRQRRPWPSRRRG